VRAAGAIAAFACAALVLPCAQGAYLVDGLADDWAEADIVGLSTHAPSSPNASVDLTSLSASENATHWFFRLDFDWLLPGENASLALYLFGPSSGAPAQLDPSGNLVSLPSGAALSYAVYIDLVPSFPTGSHVSFFDGSLWKNRTFAELGVTAARNDSAGFVELAASREGFAFLHAGFAAAAVLVPSSPSPSAPLTVVDSIPDNPAPPAGTIAGRVAFYDYTLEPPIVFTALGIADPAAVEGQNTTVFVELTNTGPKTATAITGRLSIDGRTLGSTSGLTLLGGGTAVLSYPWPVTAGTHNVTAQSFPGGALRSLVLTIPAAAAVLAILDAALKPATPAPDQPFTVEVRLRNDGNAPSALAELLLKDGTLVLSSAPVPPIAPGATATVSIPARISLPGTAHLRIEIDGVNSANGTTQLTVLIQTPSPPFGIPAVAWLAIGVAACAAAAWVITPRLKRARGPPQP
jgi:hypothetical protein